jgi:hypothetical protein
VSEHLAREGKRADMGKRIVLRGERARENERTEAGGLRTRKMGATTQGSDEEVVEIRSNLRLISRISD